MRCWQAGEAGPPVLQFTPGRHARGSPRVWSVPCCWCCSWRSSPFRLGWVLRSTSRNTLATTTITRFVRTNIRNLAGVPAIVYGLLGLAVFVTLLGLGKILIVGGLTLAILVSRSL